MRHKRVIMGVAAAFSAGLALLAPSSVLKPPFFDAERATDAAWLIPPPPFQQGGDFAALPPTAAGGPPIDFDSAGRPTPLDATAAIASASAAREILLEAPASSAYAPSLNPANPNAPFSADALLGLDLTGAREALAAYAANDLARGDQLARQASSQAVASALEWAAIRANAQQAGYRRISRFIAANPDWPMLEWARKAAEESLFANPPSPEETRVYLTGNPPISAYGKLALARAAKAQGRFEEAAALARQIWRQDNLNASLEAMLLKQFGEYLRAPDHKARAILMFYREQTGAGLRAASAAGKEVEALAAVRVASVNETANEKTFASAPAAVANDPAFIFSKIQFLRRAHRIDEAAALMLAAPRDLAQIVDGDQWWRERSMLARKLLANNNAATAYKIVSGHAAVANDLQVDAEFQSGWIALRFLNDAPTAIAHFDKAVNVARTPISRARAYYWRGRAAEANKENAQEFYARAGQESTAFYGQLARLRLGFTDMPTRRARTAAQGDQRALPVRAIEALYAAGAKNIAAPLAYAAAKSLGEADQMAALAQVVVRDRDAKVSLNIGKIASQRGFAMDDLAFPIHGVPVFTPHSNSAPLEIVYSIARQESAFDAKAVSHAGAMGLMQMIDSTARRTAQRVGVPFESARMTADPIFNAQLGAAHLGDLLTEQGQSLILTFAAYNAGGKRVREWIAAHGDPRDPRVDPIDWIELIPIAETRNYVQRVLENLALYRARLGTDPAGRAAADPLKREVRL